MAWPRTTVYVFPGSQYSAKVLAALDARGIPHGVVFAALAPSKRVLPSGGRMVPEAVVGDAVVPDSDAILHWFDDKYGTDFFPATPDIADLAERASCGVVAGAVLYYNWVFQPSYARTMRAAGLRALPAWICLFRGHIVDSWAADARKSFRAKARTQLGVELDDEAAVRAALAAELGAMQACLADGADYLRGAAQPSAADFSLYAMLERLVGDVGDVRLPCALPELVADTPDLARLWAWHATMRERHPIRFKGKRPPKATQVAAASE